MQVLKYVLTPVEAEMICDIELPIKIVSEANNRDYYRKKGERVKRQKRITTDHLQRVPKVNLSDNDEFIIQLTRLKGYRQKDMDSDNLQGGFKAVRDAIATWIGIDDRSDRMSWQTFQTKGYKPGIRVQIWRQLLND